MFTERDLEIIQNRIVEFYDNLDYATPDDYREFARDASRYILALLADVRTITSERDALRAALVNVSPPSWKLMQGVSSHRVAINVPNVPEPRRDDDTPARTEST